MQILIDDREYTIPDEVYEYIGQIKKANLVLADLCEDVLIRTCNTVNRIRDSIAESDKEFDKIGIKECLPL